MVRFRSIVLFVFLGSLWLLPLPARAQQPAPSSSEDTSGHDVAKFLGGAAVGLAAHESGHLFFDVLLDAHPHLKGVRFAGVPFFAIAHRPDLSPRREFTVSSAGFWVQHVTNELLLTRQADVRSQHAPFKKGMLAFNVLTSMAYSGAAFGRVGPYERDTRAMSDALNIDERWIGVMILTPAVLDTYRYFHPHANWAVWGSRAAKIGTALLVIK